MDDGRGIGETSLVGQIVGLGNNPVAQYRNGQVFHVIRGAVIPSADQCPSPKRLLKDQPSTGAHAQGEIRVFPCCADDVENIVGQDRFYIY